jgi:hypothetical protein
VGHGAQQRRRDAHQRVFGPFPAGAFHAVHDYANVAAFSWSAITDALGLRKDCVLPAP